MAAGLGRFLILVLMMTTTIAVVVAFTLQSPPCIVGLLIRQDDRSPREERALNQVVSTIPKRVCYFSYFLMGGLLPHLYDRSASFIRGRYGTEYISVLHLILPVRGRIVIGKSSKQPLLD
jgi:hypothetical protein